MFCVLASACRAIADRFGRRAVFLIGIGAFALSSWLCGAAPSAAALYLARAAQGVSAAFMLAPALAIIGHTFHQEEERNRAWAMWGAIMGLTMVLSPILGGVIAYALGWRWAFYINVPICIALAALRLIEESRDVNARRLDPFGFASFSAAMFGITWG
ncbi:MFS transporter [Brucella pituitosa]|uniref:MFS transporter n=1 Tax=Brucella pituitosa TaxID=571256 RepID=UPI002092D12F|nr:MFS transporter [Brucella pituitosa]